MKKLLFVLMIFVLAAGSVFADLASGLFVNAWGRGVFVPVWYDTTLRTFNTGSGVSWDPNNRPRVDFRVNGATDFVGFTVHVNSEDTTGGSIASGDNGAQLWVRPFGNDLLRLTVATHLQNDTLRGRVGTDTGFENFVMGESMFGLGGDARDPLNGNAIFTRFAGGRTGAASNESNTSTYPWAAGNVFFLSSSPIEGMFIGLMLQGAFPQMDFREAWRHVQIGVGYEIPGIGFARVQYVGGFMGRENDPLDMFNPAHRARFEAAFAFTAIEDLVLDLGIKYWAPVELINRFISTEVGVVAVERFFRGVDIAFGASYRHGDLNVDFMAQVLSIGAHTGARSHRDELTGGADGAHLVFNVIPSFNLGQHTVGLSAILQSRFAHTNRDGTVDEDSAWTRFGVGAWGRLNLAGGSLRAGITWTPPARTNLTGPAFNRGFVTIPIILEYAFF